MTMICNNCEQVWNPKTPYCDKCGFHHHAWVESKEDRDTRVETPLQTELRAVKRERDIAIGTLLQTHQNVTDLLKHYCAVMDQAPQELRETLETSVERTILLTEKIALMLDLPGKPSEAAQEYISL